MSRPSWQALLALVAVVAAVALPLADGRSTIFLVDDGLAGFLVVWTVGLAAIFAVWPAGREASIEALFIGAHAGAAYIYLFLPRFAAAAPAWTFGQRPADGSGPVGFGTFLADTAGFWGLFLAVWLLAWLLVTRLSLLRAGGRLGSLLLRILVPALFGIWLLFLWEVVTRALGVPPVLLPPPSAIGARIAASLPTLWADFRQTFLKAVIAGFAIGSGAGFLFALLVDRIPFLKRGLLPIGNLVSALPIIGIAPIMVMWFGFDWPSKAAVVALMPFFPMLVNTLAGLDAADRIQRDLMRTYAASHGQTLFKLRLPAALPFIFNGLKINTTLALIGAIVAEFFGTPIVGMGFRISTEVGRMSIDMVWAEIAVAALAGSVFYGVMALIERACT
ncbi:MAG: ABC transporter permease, partial [Rhizobiales bacterium]|nr:ABC transporter permease [Hyphomicrobiales bacterium]